jgi:hypothetical protein
MWPLLLVLVAASPAEQSFSEGRALLKAGRVEAACAAFEKSQASEPGLGTLLNLAACYEQLHAYARAYVRFRDAESWARRNHESARESVARERARALKPRLAAVTLVAPPRSGQLATAGDLRLPLETGTQTFFIDPPGLEVKVTAPGAVPWVNFVAAPREGGSVTVEVPTLASEPGELRAPAPLEVVDAPVALPVARPVSEPPPTLTRQPSVVALGGDTRHAAGVGSLVAGGLLVALGATGLVSSRLTFDGLVAQQQGGPLTVTQAQYQTARWLWPAAWVTTGLGLAAAAAGLWLLSGPAPVPVLLVPSRDGVSASFSWQL